MPSPSTSTVTTSPGWTGRDVGRRAGEDDVARHERDQPGDVGDQVVHVPGHLVGRAVLAHVVADQGEHPLVGEVPVGHDARTDRTERVGSLDAQHRAGVGVAKVVQSEVVGDGVAGDVVRGVGVGDVAGRASDDDGDLALEVEVVAVRRVAPRPPPCALSAVIGLWK